VGRRADEVEDEDEEGRQAVLMNMREEATHALQVPVCRIHQDETKQFVREGAPKNSVEGSPFGTIERGWACVRDASRSPIALPRPIHEVGVLKRHGVGDGEK
jgi:hypothetical protein